MIYITLQNLIQKILIFLAVTHLQSDTYLTVQISIERQQGNTHQREFRRPESS